MILSFYVVVASILVSHIVFLPPLEFYIYQSSVNVENLFENVKKEIIYYYYLKKKNYFKKRFISFPKYDVTIMLNVCI